MNAGNNKLVEEIDHLEPRQRAEELIKIRSKRNELAKERSRIQNVLAEINAKLRQTMALPDYQATMAQKRKLNGAISRIEEQSRALELRFQTIHALQDVYKLESVEDATIVLELRKMRDKWLAFGSNSTRMSSMRVIAAQVVEDLNPILKKLLAP